MKTRLIAALRTVGRKLANGELVYSWEETGQCNCGILAQELLGKTAHEVKVAKWEVRSGLWSDSARAGFCQITGLPNDGIFKALHKFGLSEADFANLEYLADPAVRKRIAAVPHLGFASPKVVSRYMLAWADILEEADNAAMEAYEARPLQLNKEAGPTMSGGATMVPAAQQP